jgi:hypothetical protein
MEEYILNQLNARGINVHFFGTEYNPPKEPNINGGTGVSEWISISYGIDKNENFIDTSGNDKDKLQMTGVIYGTAYAKNKIRVLELIAELEEVLTNQQIVVPEGVAFVKPPRRVISGVDGLAFGKYAFDFYI